MQTLIRQNAIIDLNQVEIGQLRLWKSFFKRYSNTI
jgi:hypothetical protein